MTYRGMAQVYDRLMAGMPYQQWLAWTQQMWLQQFGRYPQRVVELGCGTGTVTIPLSEAGVSMIGIDLSADMLACAREKWENNKKREPKQAEVLWLQQDLTEWSLPEPVEAIIAYCDVFNYLNTMEQMEAAFRMAYNGLKEDGLFLFDMLPADRFEMYASAQPFVVDEGDLSYFWFCEYDQKGGHIEHDLTFFVQEETGDCYKKINEIHTQTAYDPDHVVKMLKQTGFRQASWNKGQFLDADELADRFFFTVVK